MNANVHLRVAVGVRIPEDQMSVYYPKLRKGLETSLGPDHVK